MHTVRLRQKMYLNVRISYMAFMAVSALVIYMTFLSNLSAGTSLSFRSLHQFPVASYHRILANIRPDTPPHSRTLGVASHIYVLSLPRRGDRRRSMNSLSRALDLHFEYVDGVEATDASVDHALDTLKRERKAFRQKYYQNRGVVFPGFAFPSLEDLEQRDIENGEDWLNDTSSLLSPSLSTLTPILKPSRTKYTKSYDKNVLPCATPEDPFPALLNKNQTGMLPPWRILSRGMVACWIAHHKIIYRIAELRDRSAVAIVLEDDVDMEFDIARRLQGLWQALPVNGWDIVMLGYCHSEELVYPPLAGAASVRPSFAPKCTHAYALSRFGARRLYQILSTSGFAYSRALDQAISWLINTNELRSYSIVPAIVVQNKRTRSDIWRHNPNIAGQTQSSSSGNEKGSKWRDVLVDSTLERVQMAANGHYMIENA